MGIIFDVLTLRCMWYIDVLRACYLAFSLCPPPQRFFVKIINYTRFLWYNPPGRLSLGVLNSDSWEMKSYSCCITYRKASIASNCCRATVFTHLTVNKNSHLKYPRNFYDPRLTSPCQSGCQVLGNHSESSRGLIDSSLTIFAPDGEIVVIRGANPEPKRKLSIRCQDSFCRLQSWRGVWRQLLRQAGTAWNTPRKSLAH